MFLIYILRKIISNYKSIKKALLLTNLYSIVYGIFYLEDIKKKKKKKKREERKRKKIAQ